MAAAEPRQPWKRDRRNSVTSATTGTSSWSGRELFDSVLEAVTMIDSTGTIILRNDKFKMDYPNVRKYDSVEETIWFKETRTAHKELMSNYVISKCPMVMGRNRHVTANLRGVATPINLGVFAAGENFVGMMVPIDPTSLWCVVHKGHIISASSPAVSAFGDPPDGKAVSEVLQPSLGFDGLSVFAMMNRGTTIKHVLVEKIALDNEAVCWKMKDLTGVVRNHRLALEEAKFEIEQDHQKSYRGLVVREIDSQIDSLRKAVRGQDLGQAEEVLEYVEDATRAIQSFLSGRTENSECVMDVLIKQMIRLAHTSQIVQPGVEVGFSGPPDVVYHGQIPAVRIFLMNTIRNAAKATTEGQITVELAQPSPGQLTIQVKDTGCGLLPEQLDQLVAPEFQGSQSPGLRLIRLCADRLGAQLDVSVSVSVRVRAR
eukprot:TRINITY_DN7474_c0_g2_i2.p1 TRINITY_DN7474_c0_g2~~TRINITY_DN7474_c0_g2_i2.p1  ORF type:complete len:429 (-),score=127.88 TRINITY_DN7474_c0_g2_i2:348-1634(-)